MAQSHSIDKLAFMNKLVGIMEYIETNCNDGAYLFICNELKQIVDMIKELKNEKHYQHLNRVRERAIRLANLPINLPLKKIRHICPDCGRRVVHLEEHQRRDVCWLIKKEKEVSYKQFEKPFWILNGASVSIQKVWRGHRVRKNI